MGIEINHLIVPATDKNASAEFLSRILGVDPAPPAAHFRPVQVGSVTLDFDNATEIRSMHIAFLVDEATFEGAYQRLLDAGTPTYADPSRSRPGEINHRFGGRGVYFDDPDGHFFELLTAAPPAQAAPPQSRARESVDG